MIAKLRSCLLEGTDSPTLCFSFMLARRKGGRIRTDFVCVAQVLATFGYEHGAWGVADGEDLGAPLYFLSSVENTPLQPPYPHPHPHPTYV